MSNMNEKSGAIKGRNPKSSQCMPSFAESEVKDAAIWIEMDRYVPKYSFPSIAGPATDHEITGLSFSSDLERLNGIVVHGDAWEESEYSVKKSDILLSGYGCSDFSSRGAGALVIGGGTLNLEDVNITTKGSGRCATIATEHGTLIARRCKFASYGGPLPADYEPVIGPGMMEPPWPLGLSGNCRTHLSMDSSRSYFYDCDFYAAAWGAISTDSSGGCLYLECNDCRIEVPGNGYGTYADNGCHNVFNRCSFHTGNVLAIMDGNSSVTCLETDGDCEKTCFMIHGALKDYVDSSILEISGGSYHSKDQIIYAKSANADIYVRNADMQADSGVILRSICNDDQMYYDTAAKGNSCYGVQITFESMKLSGSILHEDSDRKMLISLVDTTLCGAVTGYPVLMFYGTSRWFTNTDSEITLVNPEDISYLDAPSGITITAKFKGKAPDTDCILPSGGQLRVF